LGTYMKKADEKKSGSINWLVYERCAACFALDRYGGMNVTITPNARIIGKLSGKLRQIDVLIDARWDERSCSRIIVDAKFHGRKVAIKDIESFEGMMRDCRAERGVIVSPKGFTRSAYHRAQDAITVTTLTLEQLGRYSWVYEPCLGDCSVSTDSGTKRGMVLWDDFLIMESGGFINTVQTGKCDRCHSFHVWCWDCGERFIVPENEIVRCGCEERLWAALPDSVDIERKIILDSISSRSNDRNIVQSMSNQRIILPRNPKVKKSKSIWLLTKYKGEMPIKVDRRPIC